MDDRTVEQVAKLARVKVADSGNIAKDLSNIFDMIEQMQEVDTDGVEDFLVVDSKSLRTREDEVLDGNKTELVLKNAPEQKMDCFSVPKVVDAG